VSKVVKNTLMSDVESTFYAAVDAAQGVLQSALVGATVASAKAASIAYHRSVVAAAQASGQPGLGTPSLYALRDLTGGA
jgi:hypothetical protein